MTPTVRLLQADWYRRDKRYDTPVVLLLRFNQPVSAASLLPHLTLQHAPHDFRAPTLPSTGLPHALALDPRAAEAFAAKVAAAAAAAASRAPVTVRAAPDWNKTQFPPSDDLLVLETTDVPPPDTWLRIVVGAEARGVQGTETPKEAVEKTVELERTLFVEGLRCASACDPDHYNPLQFRGRVPVSQARRALRAVDVTDGARPRPLAPSKPPAASDENARRRADGRVRLRPGLGGDAGGRRLRRVARAHLCGHGLAGSHRRRRAGPRLCVGGAPGELAPARLCQLRRRPRGVGVGRRRPAALPRAQPADGDAVAPSAARRRADADRARGAGEVLQPAARISRARCAGCSRAPTSSSPSASTSHPPCPRAAGAWRGRRSRRGRPSRARTRRRTPPCGPASSRSRTSGSR